jgi:hypothetical protein
MHVVVARSVLKILTTTPRPRTYIAQLSKYRERVWTCQRTGTSGLTYEEAQSSEANLERAKVRRALPLTTNLCRTGATPERA